LEIGLTCAPASCGAGARGMNGDQAQRAAVDVELQVEEFTDANAAVRRGDSGLDGGHGADRVAREHDHVAQPTGGDVGRVRAIPGDLVDAVPLLPFLDLPRPGGLL